MVFHYVTFQYKCKIFHSVCKTNKTAAFYLNEGPFNSDTRCDATAMTQLCNLAFQVIDIPRVLTRNATHIICLHLQI